MNHLNNIEAAIKSIAEGVEGIGNVFDSIIYASSDEEVKEFFSKDDFINTLMFKERATDENPDNFTGRGTKVITTERTFTFILFYGYNKEQNSAGKIKAIKENLLRAFNDNPKFIVDPLDPLDIGVINEHDLLSLTTATDFSYYGIMVHSMEFQINVKDTQTVIRAVTDPVDSIVLTAPVNGAEDLGPDNISFEWVANPEAANYGVQIASNIIFNNPVIEFYGWPLNKFTIPEGLLNSGTVYYWRVSGRNIIGQGAWSAVNIFQTA